MDTIHLRAFSAPQKKDLVGGRLSLVSITYSDNAAIALRRPGASNATSEAYTHPAMSFL
jgi:hypothetical protein